MPPGLAVDLGQRARGDITGIVDENIDVLAELAERLDLLGECQIAAMHADLDAMFAPQALGGLLQRGLVTRGQMQIAAFRRQRVGDDEADALGGAGDESKP